MVSQGLVGEYPRGYKTDLVKEFARKFPEAGVGEIIRKIEKMKNVHVASGMTSKILQKIREGKIPANGVYTAPAATESVDTTIVPPVVSNLQKITTLVNEIGSIEEAESLLNTLKTLQLIPK
jgi:hypothetical protein